VAKERGASARIRRDSHLALGCGLVFALLVVAGLILFELI